MIVVIVFVTAIPAIGRTGLQDTVGLDENPGAYIPLDLTFYDENGTSIALREILDRPVILTLVYLDCSHMCPQLLSALATAVDTMQLAPGKDYRLVTVSFDENDTPADARNSKANYTTSIERPFTGEAWKFLTGDAENIRIIAEAVGVRFRKMDHGFDHPEVLIFLSPEGRITKYMNVPKYDYGMAYPVIFSTMEMQTAIGEAARNEVDAAMAGTPLYCFLHEPPGQRRLFAVMKILGVITLMLLAILYVVLRSTGREARAGDGGRSGK